MLQLRPNCECGDRDLPPESADAFICSFECTFCRSCRPSDQLAKNPASKERVYKPQGCATPA